MVASDSQHFSNHIVVRSSQRSEGYLQLDIGNSREYSIMRKIFISTGTHGSLASIMFQSTRAELLPVPECGSFSIILTPSNNGTYEPVPPFYIISFAVSGPVTVDRLHGDEVNGGTLVWEAVRHAQGQKPAHVVVPMSFTPS